MWFLEGATFLGVRETKRKPPKWLNLSHISGLSETPACFSLKAARSMGKHDLNHEHRTCNNKNDTQDDDSTSDAMITILIAKNYDTDAHKATNANNDKIANNAHNANKDGTGNHDNTGTSDKIVTVTVRMKQ